MYFYSSDWGLAFIFDSRRTPFFVWCFDGLTRKRHFEESVKLHLQHSMFGPLIQQKHGVSVTNKITGRYVDVGEFRHITLLSITEMVSRRPCDYKDDARGHTGGEVSTTEHARRRTTVPPRHECIIASY
jgi:hypothetical protein